MHIVIITRAIPLPVSLVHPLSLSLTCSVRACLLFIVVHTYFVKLSYMINANPLSTNTIENICVYVYFSSIVCLQVALGILYVCDSKQYYSFTYGLFIRVYV